MSETEQHLSEEDVRASKIENYKKNGDNPFKFNFNKTHHAIELQEQNANLKDGEYAETQIKTAGRLIAKRGHGKATFGNVLDDTGTIQYYANVNELGEEKYNKLLNFDIGDIIGLSGKMFRTRRGELSINVDDIELLTKAMKPLPEKYHGLKDKELRYRHRYIDLIANQDVKETFRKRSEIITKIREVLGSKEFIEVETPVLQSIYGGAAARPFTTHHNELGQDLYLRVSLELPLKRLIVGGFEKIFEIGRVFRNEGVSFKHNPEYTLLELYQAYADYNDIMNLTEELIGQLVFEINGSHTLTYQGTELNFKPPFKRLTMDDALKEHAGISIHASTEELAAKAKELGLDIPENALRGHLINSIYDKTVEHHLIQPTFIIDYPWETSPLAKRKRDDENLVERFELIVNTMEIANAFSELNDPDDQLSRFEDQGRAREAGDDEAHQMDLDYIEALKQGMPPTGGLGIGIDRVVMLLTNSPSIRDIIFFPHMK